VLERELGAGGRRVALRLSRKVALRPDNEAVTSTPAVTFVQDVRLEPGRYTLTTVMTDPGSPAPDAVRVEVEVPEVPERELFITGPILGRAAGPNVVIQGGDHDEGDIVRGGQSFEPLLVQEIERPEDLVALTQACLVAGQKRRATAGASPVVERWLVREDGERVGSLPPESLALEGTDGVLCQSFVDLLPADSLPHGDYRFGAEVRGTDEPADRRELGFTVSSPQ
jgi:hypothetical protein